MEKQIIYQGPGVLSILLVAFIVLKLCGVITWPWFWVLAPLWVPIVLILEMLLIVGIIVYVNVRQVRSRRNSRV